MTCRRKRTVGLIASSLVALAGTTAVLFLLSGPTPAHADSPRYVAPDCTGVPAPCHATIQDAIDAADPGDEIRVAMGHYTGVHVRDDAVQVVQVDKDLTIRGGYDNSFQQSFPLTQPTVVDAEGQGRVIYVRQYVSSTIEGLWITGGNAAHAIQSPHHGGGICSYGATLIVASNVISHNVATTSTSSRGYGGGMYIYGSAVISGNRVISNVASTSYAGKGGGMYISHGDGVQVINNVVLSNMGTITGGQGIAGGIYLIQSDGAIVDGNRIEHNLAQARLAPFDGAFGGGVICHYSDDTVFRNNVIRHNTANAQMSSGGGGGIGIWASDRVWVQSNTLEYNTASMTASGWGGGLRASDSHGLLIDSNRVLSNSAALGGGLHIVSDSSFTMTNNIVAGNIGSYQGGGMAFAVNPSKGITGTLVHNSFATNNQGSGEGRSAIQIDDPRVTLVLTNNLIYSHTYGILVDVDSTAQLYNTLFYANDSDTSGAGEIINTDPITGQDPLLDADHHLQAGSPAIDAGADADVSTDIDGDSRPEDGDLDGTAAVDVGADEFTLYRIYLPLVVKQ